MSSHPYSDQNPVPTFQNQYQLLKQETDAQDAHRRDEYTADQLKNVDLSNIEPLNFGTGSSSQVDVDEPTATDIDHTSVSNNPRRSYDSSSDASETMAGSPVVPKSGLPPRETLSNASTGTVSSEEKNGRTDGEREKEETMERLNANKLRPTETVKRTRGERVVDDPVTGGKVAIRDAQFEEFPPPPDPDAPYYGATHGHNLQGSSTSSSSHKSQGRRTGTLNPLSLGKKGIKGVGKGVGKGLGGVAHFIRPSRSGTHAAYPSNISLQPFAPAAPVEIKSSLNLLLYAQIGIIGAFTLIWLLFAFDSHASGSWIWSLWRFVTRSTVIGATGFACSFAVNKATRKIEREVERVRFEMHRQRGEKFAAPTPESVEWLNAFVKTIWGLINPEMFVPIADMVEDVMQQSIPGFVPVSAVRISDIGQGSNPFRIISMRALPDQPGHRDYPREEWIDQGTQDLQRAAEKAREDGKEGVEDQSGDYVNYEIAFSYQAQPGQGDELKERNLHMLLEFFVGIADLMHIPIPIWAQVDGIAGTVRLRIQFIPEPPFVRNVTFTFMGIPAVDVSVTPMSKNLPNVLDLPLVSSFVKMAIAAGTVAFVAPRSMTLNLQEMLSGAAIGDTRALGVFMIRIKYAEDLSAQDRNGKSDPYIVLAYAKFGKPLYSTRIILGDLNPVFEETAFLLVTQDEVNAEENLAAMLWDSDKRTADDLIGRVTIPVKELMSKPNQMFARRDGLAGYEDATDMQGFLHWEIGFFDKVPLNRDLEKPLDPPQPPTKSAAAKEMRPDDKAPNPAAYGTPPPKPDVKRTPPERKYPSGILSVIIHQINGLERQNLKGASGSNREGTAGQDTDEANEQGSNLPSAYCEIILNDDMIFKTRVKQYTSMPFFEAGTEVFVRDWTQSVVRIAVRDSRLREKDPLLGIIDLPLWKVFEEASEVTQLYSIQEGVGFGRVNVSLLFKAVDMNLPKCLLGWDTGTVEILKPIQVEILPEHRTAFNLKDKSIVVTTTDSTEKIPPTKESEGQDSDARHIWKFDKPVRLPVYSRHASSLIFELGSKGVVTKKPLALTVHWLNELPDDEEVEVKLPIVVGKDLVQLRQNVLNEATKKTHEYTTIGWLTTSVRLDRGLDADHEKHARGGSIARRHAFETYDHIEGEALVAEKNAHASDDGEITKEERKALDAAHKKQLHNRHRGVMQFRPYRTAIWMKDGVKNRLTTKKNNGKREPTVKSEA